MSMDMYNPDTNFVDLQLLLSSYIPNNMVKLQNFKW